MTSINALYQVMKQLDPAVHRIYYYGEYDAYSLALDGLVGDVRVVRKIQEDERMMKSRSMGKSQSWIIEYDIRAEADKMLPTQMIAVKRIDGQSGITLTCKETQKTRTYTEAKIMNVSGDERYPWYIEGAGEYVAVCRNILNFDLDQLDRYGLFFI